MDELTTICRSNDLTGPQLVVFGTFVPVGIHAGQSVAGRCVLTLGKTRISQMQYYFHTDHTDTPPPPHSHHTTYTLVCVCATYGLKLISLGRMLGMSLSRYASRGKSTSLGGGCVDPASFV